MMDEIADDMDVVMNYATTDEHVPESERNNHIIQERIRAAYHNLPFKVIPKVMIKHLAMVSTEQLNMFPAKGGVSPYLSPHMILTGRSFDYNKHCTIPFGAYVQANNQNHPTNTNAPRTLDCIYLRPTNNKQGGHELMNIATGGVITRSKVTEIPISHVVLQAVEKMAYDQGIKTLKITNRRGNILPLADHIAGVEYDEDVDDNDDTDEDFEQDDESYYDPDQDFDESDDDWFDTVDQDEVDDIFADNQNEHVKDELPDLIERGDEESDVSDEDEESEATYVRRSSRDIEQPKCYQAAQVNKGNGKQVTFQDQAAHELEQVHNLIFHSTYNTKVK